MSADIKRIKDVLKLLEKSPFYEIEWEEADFKIKVKKGSNNINSTLKSNIIHHPQIEPPKKNENVHESLESEIELTEGRAIIRSPLVGTFFTAPSPTTQPFVKEGDIIKPGQVLCIIEAMKLMNEIECDRAGKIAAILVNNAQPVEYGEPLFIIETQDF